MNLSAGNLVMQQHNPKINAVSQITEPMPFPRAKPACPEKAAITETVASALVVPMLTIVAPMMTLGMPNFFAMLTEPSTNQSAPLHSIAKLTSVKRNISEMCFVARFIKNSSGIKCSIELNHP